MSTDLMYHEGLIPVIVQESHTKTVLMFAFANEEAVRLTKSTGYAHYFSRSRQKLWKKGEESGNLQKIVEIRMDCDQDCLLYLVEQTGCACHEGYLSCFYRTLDGTVIIPQMRDPKQMYH